MDPDYNPTGLFPIIESLQNDRHPFTHSQIDAKTQIRVISVQPQLNDDGVLQCNIEDTTLSTDYKCLSYMWGKSNGFKRIHLNGCEILVRRNLHNFLHLARARHAGEKIWIDAVCINQEDNEERQQQVCLMREIYTKAQQVLVYLGHGMDNIAGAVEWAGLLQAEQLEPATPFGPSPTNWVEQRWGLHGARASGCIRVNEHLDTSSLDIIPGIEGLYKLPYWTRAWIKQELLLNGNVVVYYGTSTCRVNDLAAISFAASLPPPQEKTQGSVMLEDLRSRKIYNLDSFKLTNHMPHEEYLMKDGLELITRYSTSECADFHDHIYAFLSLTIDEFAFPVDYTCSRVGLWLMTLSKARGCGGWIHDVCNIGVSLFHTLGLTLEDLNEVKLKQVIKHLGLESWKFRFWLEFLCALERPRPDLLKSMSERGQRKYKGRLTLRDDPVSELMVNDVGVEKGQSCRPGDQVLRIGCSRMDDRPELYVVARRDHGNITRIVAVGYRSIYKHNDAALNAFFMSYPSPQWTSDSCQLLLERKRLSVDMATLALLIKHFVALNELWRRKGGHAKEFKRPKKQGK